MALFSTLSMSVIGNLHRSWKEVPAATQNLHKSLVAFLNHTSNYKPYRDALDATTEGCIPILGKNGAYLDAVSYFDSISGLIMRDLIYIEEMDTKEDGYINWEKMSLLAKVLGQVLRFQKQKYSFAPQSLIMDYFMDLRSCSLVMNEDELYSLYQKIKAEEGSILLRSQKYTDPFQMKANRDAIQSIKVESDQAEFPAETALAVTRRGIDGSRQSAG
jgi:hypothetical protein